ncbi:hypothetical protein BG000_001909 [Podila horticola]|nr:hypothetical protein BG000_001909 [Podila horticola]
MAQFKVLRTTVLSSNVVGISVKEDGMTTAKMIRHQPQFHFCVLQIVCSSDPHTVFKLEMHRLEHDACSRKDIFTGYDAAMTKTIIPGSSTARLLSAHLVVLLEELLKTPSIVKVVYDWQYFLSSANKTLASAMRSVNDHENIVDLFKIGLIFSKTKCYARNTTPSTILHRNQDQTKMIATLGGTLSAWTLRPNLARTFYGHNSVTSLLFKITGKRIGTTHWAEEPNLPYKTPVFRAKCQFADEKALFLLEVYSLLQNVRQLKG